MFTCLLPGLLAGAVDQNGWLEVAQEGLSSEWAAEPYIMIHYFTCLEEMIVVSHTEEGKGPRVRDTCLNWKKTLGLKIKNPKLGIM